MGCVLAAGLGQAPARQAGLGAGLPLSAEAVTVNKMCGSGMQAAIMAHDALAAGSAALIVAGGMESMTNAPYALRSEEHTSELQSLMRISYAVFRLKKKKQQERIT